MTFTKEQMDILRTMYNQAFVHEYGLSLNFNQGFGYWGIRILENGSIEEYWNKPLDIDCDSGTVHKRDEGNIIYLHFDEFIKIKRGLITN